MFLNRLDSLTFSSFSWLMNSWRRFTEHFKKILRIFPQKFQHGQVISGHLLTWYIRNSKCSMDSWEKDLTTVLCGMQLPFGQKTVKLFPEVKATMTFSFNYSQGTFKDCLSK